MLQRPFFSTNPVRVVRNLDNFKSVKNDIFVCQRGSNLMRLWCPPGRSLILPREKNPAKLEEKSAAMSCFDTK